MKYLVIVTVLLLIVLPAWAQESVEEICPGAQAWYDNIDPDKVVRASLSTIMDADERVSVRFGAVDDVNSIIEAVEESDSPECVEQAKLWYLEGLTTFTEAGENYIDGNLTEFILQMMTAMQTVGQFRGYMTAIGVEIEQDETSVWYMK